MISGGGAAYPPDSMREAIARREAKLGFELPWQCEDRAVTKHDLEAIVQGDVTDVDFAALANGLYDGCIVGE